MVFVMAQLLALSVVKGLPRAKAKGSRAKKSSNLRGFNPRGAWAYSPKHLWATFH